MKESAYSFSLLSTANPAIGRSSIVIPHSELQHTLEQAVIANSLEINIPSANSSWTEEQGALPNNKGPSLPDESEDLAE